MRHCDAALHPVLYLALRSPRPRTAVAMMHAGNAGRSRISWKQHGQPDRILGGCNYGDREEGDVGRKIVGWAGRCGTTEARKTLTSPLVPVRGADSLARRLHTST